MIDLPAMIKESRYRGLNDAGEKLYYHPHWKYFKLRVDGRYPYPYPDWGGDLVPVKKPKKRLSAKKRSDNVIQTTEQRK